MHDVNYNMECAIMSIYIVYTLGLKCINLVMVDVTHATYWDCLKLCCRAGRRPLGILSWQSFEDCILE